MSQQVDTHALEHQLTAEWAGDASVRLEFNNQFDDFKAYKLAEARGLVHRRTDQVSGGRS